MEVFWTIVIQVLFQTRTPGICVTQEIIPESVSSSYIADPYPVKYIEFEINKFEE